MWIDAKDFYGNPTEELMPIGFRMFQQVINKEIQFYPMHHLTAASYKYVFLRFFMFLNCSDHF